MRILYHDDMGNVEMSSSDNTVENSISIPTWCKISLALGIGAAVTYWFYKKRQTRINIQYKIF